MDVEKENQALAIVERLRTAGFKAFLAGGCVRDRVLGVTPKDYDIATDARPDAVQRLFDHTVAVGARFGVIMVVLGDHHFEVATFRADAGYRDGRHPDAVRFGTIEDDVQRRDFTIGGMYFDPSSGRVIDLVGGLRDLRAGVIRAIGDVGLRFAEDHLRMLRAVRFAARLDFAIEPATWAAICLSAPAITHIAAERVGEEVVMIMTEGGAARGLELLAESGLAAVVMPEILDLPGCDQPANFHPEGNVWRHTRLMLSMLARGCSETLAFGTLLHDIAKPRCFAREASGKMTYYGHTDIGAEMAVEMMRRMRRSRFVQERVAYLVRDHLRLCMAPRMRPATLKRMVAEEGFDELLELALRDALASSSYLGFYHLCRRELAALGTVAERAPRLIGGDDLIAMGFVPGPAFKTILREVDDLQLDGVLATREQALDYVRDHHPAPAAAARN
ncbi:MAG TPA: CCA tRNA nucleotidyltransferase [Candidatus Binataceae bacterium]|nr:CCA tRNA nucleotidyltransferase [Candidatus Binataceae bacterium]